MIWAAVAFGRKQWRWLVVGALVIALGLAWHSRNIWKHEAGQWKLATNAWIKAFDAQKSAYEAARAAARAKAEAQNVKFESRYRTLAERADNADQEIADLRSATDRFARANRMRRQDAGTAAGAARGSPAASQGHAAPSDHQSGDDAIVVPRGDFDVLIENTIRLKQAHDWGQSLIAEGLAARPEGD